VRVINVVSNYEYIYEDGKVIKKELVKEKGIITSFIHPKYLISITKKFDKSLDINEILLEMEKFIYSYPGVDVNKEYKSIFLNIKREDFLIIEAILVDTNVLKEHFKNILKVYKYIDFISPSFLAWSEYYNFSEPKNDIFIYLDENESFLSGYSNKEYLFHRHLTTLASLSKILNKDINDVINILKSKGLDINLYEDEYEYNVIDRFFSEFFLKVFNIINLVSNEYKVKFNRIIFYSPFDIKGLFDKYKNYWELNSIEFQKSVLPTEYNHLEYLITIFNAKNYTNDNINLSIFKKPPPFITTKTGIFALSVFSLIFLLLVYFFYEQFNILKEEKFIKKLQNRYLTLKKQYNFNELKLLKKENAKLKEEIKKINKNIEEITQKIDFLYEKAKEPLFYNTLAKIAKSMKKYSLKASKIEKSGKLITIYIVSNYDNIKEVTSFMNDLMSFGFKDVKATFVKNSKNYYLSKVSFKNE